MIYGKKLARAIVMLCHEAESEEDIQVLNDFLGRFDLDLSEDSYFTLMEFNTEGS